MLISSLKGGKHSMNTTQKQKGFTIIEVVLVLAIAGLIFLMVFIALPALQRGQRDTQRQNDMSRLQTAVTNYTSVNRGNVPPGSGTWTGFIEEYLAIDGDDFLDPNGAPADSDATTYQIVETLTLTAPAGADNTIYATPEAVCSSDNASILEDAGSRKIAFRIALEGGGFYCVNN